MKAGEKKASSDCVSHCFDAKKRLNLIVRSPDEKPTPAKTVNIPRNAGKRLKQRLCCSKCIKLGVGCRNSLLHRFSRLQLCHNGMGCWASRHRGVGLETTKDGGYTNCIPGGSLTLVTSSGLACFSSCPVRRTSAVSSSSSESDHLEKHGERISVTRTA